VRIVPAGRAQKLEQIRKNISAIPDPDAINQLIACLDMNASVPLDAIAYKFDIVLRGRRSTLFENRLEGN
jgi:protocatechuate 3,4-dioxygenase beta subunit